MLTFIVSTGQFAHDWDGMATKKSKFRFKTSVAQTPAGNITTYVVAVGGAQNIRVSAKPLLRLWLSRCRYPKEPRDKVLLLDGRWTCTSATAYIFQTKDRSNPLENRVRSRQPRRRRRPIIYTRNTLYNAIRTCIVMTVRLRVRVGFTEGVLRL